MTNRKSYMSFRLVPKSVTLNDLEQRNSRCIALFHWIWYTCVPTHNRVDLWRNLCTSLLYFVVRVRCRRKESSRSLSHLLMSFLFFFNRPTAFMCKECVSPSQTSLAQLGWLCLWATTAGDGGSGPVPDRSSETVRLLSRLLTLVVTTDDWPQRRRIDDSRCQPASCSAGANETCYKSSLTVTQPLRNCIRISLCVAIKSEMAVFECSGVRGRILGRPTAHTLICIVNPPDIGRSGARFSAAGILYLYKDSFTPQWRYAEYFVLFVILRSYYRK